MLCAVAYRLSISLLLILQEHSPILFLELSCDYLRLPTLNHLQQSIMDEDVLGLKMISRQRWALHSKLVPELTYLSLDHEAASVTHGLDKVEYVNVVLLSNPLHLTHDGDKCPSTANTSTEKQSRE